MLNFAKNNSTVYTGLPQKTQVRIEIMFTIRNMHIDMESIPCLLQKTCSSRLSWLRFTCRWRV